MVAGTNQVFRLPDLGEGLTEAELVQWLVAVGDMIGVDQAIAEVETAKSVVELPSPYAGVVSALYGAAGETIAVGSPIIEVAAEGGVVVFASPPEHEGATTTPAGSNAKEEPSESIVELEAYREEERAGSGNVLIGYGTSAHHGAVRRRAPRKPHGGTSPAESAGVTVAPGASAGRDLVAKVSPVAEDERPAPAQTRTAPRSGPVPVRSPLLRRLARDLGVNLGSLVPSGADGSITRADILGAASESESAPVKRSDPAPAAQPPASGDGPREIGRERLSMLRRAVSAKMTRSRSEIPEATVWVDVDATQLWELRGQMTRGEERPPSLTALIARFTLLGLARYPLLASRLSDDGQEVIRFEGVDLGIAADTERGLIVPTISRADLLTVADLDHELRTLTTAAREGSIPPERLRGSTFTLNNYGSLGVDGSAAIINHPEVAILGIGRMIDRAWVVQGEIVPRRIVQLSLVFDHRICDGGYAAGFLNHVVSSIERPLGLYPNI